MKAFLFFATVYGVLIPAQSINGVIWNRKQEEFVPIFSISLFAAMNEKVIEESRKKEIHNFQGQILRYMYHEDRSFIEFDAENARPSGIIGDVWSILSESLNFTLQPIHTNENSLGVSDENNTFNGLLGTLQRNEADIIPRSEMYPKMLLAAKFTVPLWKTRYRLFILDEMKYDYTWMMKLFSWKVWCATLVTYLILSVCGFASHVISTNNKQKNAYAKLDEYLFYDFGMMCSQCYIPNYFWGRSRTLEVVLSLFSSIIKIAFSALLIVYMTRKVYIPPFRDINSLLDETSYKIITYSGSLPHLAFQKKKRLEYKRVVDMNRLVIAPTVEDMYAKGCLPTEKYAALDSEDSRNSRRKDICRLHATGINYFENWISSALSHNFTHKKAIDIGILRLYEHGMINMLRHRWLGSTQTAKNTLQHSEPITLDQVNLILMTFYLGVLLSVLICILENLFHYIIFKK